MRYSFIFKAVASIALFLADGSHDAFAAVCAPVSGENPPFHSGFASGGFARVEAGSSVPPSPTGSKEILVNIPISVFDGQLTDDPLKEIKYFRTFGVDFRKPKVDGLYQYADARTVKDFIRYTRAHGKEVIWTLNMTSRTLETEMEYVKQLMKNGLNITAFEYGGEFYLPKYAKGDLSKKAVVEKVTAEIYTDMLSEWLPAFMEVLPLSEGDHIVIGASHGNSDSQRDRYRKQWNTTVAAYLQAEFPEIADDLSWSFHLYAGARSKAGKGEEDVVDRLDFSFMKEFPEEMKIFVTESGYEVAGFSASELKKARDFWAALYRALRPGDVFGIHMLVHKGNKPNPYALIDRSGELTPVGEKFRDWLKERNEEGGSSNHASETEGNSAVLRTLENRKSVFSHIQLLTFSDRSTLRFTTCRWFGSPRYTQGDVGKPKKHFTE